MKYLKWLWLCFRLELLCRDVPPEEAKQAITEALLADALRRYSKALRRQQ